jgi:hypothetical protein
VLDLSDVNAARLLLPALVLFAGACKVAPSQPTTFASATELRECDGQPLPPYDGKDKVRVIVRVKERMPRAFSPVSLCVRVDDKLVSPQPKTAHIEQLSTGIGFVGDLPPGEHKVKVKVIVAGLTGSDIEGQRFEAEADKDVPSGATPLMDLLLTAGGPPEKRLVFKWDDEVKPAAPPP